MKRLGLIFHIDVNSAFLSWEAVIRARAGEANLREIPSAIGGEPGKSTGRSSTERTLKMAKMFT